MGEPVRKSKVTNAPTRKLRCSTRTVPTQPPTKVVRCFRQSHVVPILDIKNLGQNTGGVGSMDGVLGGCYGMPLGFRTALA